MKNTERIENYQPLTPSEIVTFEIEAAGAVIEAFCSPVAEKIVDYNGSFFYEAPVNILAAHLYEAWEDTAERRGSENPSIGDRRLSPFQSIRGLWPAGRTALDSRILGIRVHPERCPRFAGSANERTYE